MLIKIALDVVCGKCGNDLSAEIKYNEEIITEPCELCINEAYQEGVDESK